MRISNLFTALSGLTLAVSATAAAAEYVISENTIINDNLCVGASCVQIETYSGWGTLRLKSNGNRFEVDDTSTVSGWPSNDWAILFNDNDNGAASYFSVSDETAGHRPFTIAAGAPENALYVANDGKIGLGTMLPQTNLHIFAQFGTPSIRLEDAVGTPYTWDIRGNNGGLYIYDPQTSGLPFEIRSGAPNRAFIIQSSGDIGLGTFLPEAALHLRRLDGSAQMLIEETSATTTPRSLLKLKNNGRPEIVMGNTDTGGEWSFGAGTNFILKQGAVGSASSAKTKLFEVTDTGNATLAGSLTTGGPTCGSGCDAVFDPDYDLPSITDHAAQMYALGHLPNVGPTVPGAPLNMSEQYGRLLNELEQAHIYIARLETRLARVEAELSH